MYLVICPNVIFGLFYCRCWPPTTRTLTYYEEYVIQKNLFCLLLIRPFVNGASTSDVCAFIAGNTKRC